MVQCVLVQCSNFDFKNPLELEKRKKIKKLFLVNYYFPVKKLQKKYF